MCTVLTTLFFFFNATATTEIYTLSLHDALPIYDEPRRVEQPPRQPGFGGNALGPTRQDDKHRLGRIFGQRSEEHTSELQSQSNLVCRLLLEKKKKNKKQQQSDTNNQTIHHTASA